MLGITTRHHGSRRDPRFINPAGYLLLIVAIRKDEHIFNDGDFFYRTDFNYEISKGIRDAYDEFGFGCLTDRSTPFANGKNIIHPKLCIELLVHELTASALLEFRRPLYCIHTQCTFNAALATYTSAFTHKHHRQTIIEKVRELMRLFVKSYYENNPAPGERGQNPLCSPYPRRHTIYGGGWHDPLMTDQMRNLETDRNNSPRVLSA